jgi:glucose repression mediator protein
MSHTQPSPTAGVGHHPMAAAHPAAHPQVNGHMPAIPAQAQKGVPMTTAQKIATLNEQVWLSIGKNVALKLTKMNTNRSD